MVGRISIPNAKLNVVCVCRITTLGSTHFVCVGGGCNVKTKVFQIKTELRFLTASFANRQTPALPIGPSR